jgi:hypothetical protein
MNSVKIPFIISLVTFAYLKINGSTADNKLHVPESASFNTLRYIEGRNFFIDILDRFKIICEANAVLGETAPILESKFAAEAEKVSAEFQEEFATELLEFDWNEDAFSGIEYREYYYDNTIFDNLAFLGDSC